MLFVATRQSFAMAVPLCVAIGFPVVVIIGAPCVVEVLEGHVLENGLPNILLLIATK